MKTPTVLDSVRCIRHLLFFGLDALSEELEDPFGVASNDLALDALCRVCEISVFEALGDVPPKLSTADHYVLT